MYVELARWRCKAFKFGEDLSFKWYGRKSKKLVIVKDNRKGYPLKLLQARAIVSNSSDAVEVSVSFDLSDDCN